MKFPGTFRRSGGRLFPPPAAVRDVHPAIPINVDGWTDILVVDSRPIYFFVNPKGEWRRWDRYNVVPDATSEIELFRDSDGKPEVLFTGPGGVMAYAKPDSTNPTSPWNQ